MRPDRTDWAVIWFTIGFLACGACLLWFFRPETVRATQLLPLYEIVPVWRFWSPKLEGHFWTADPNERDKLIEQYAHVWTYEGVVFGVHGKAPEVQP